MACSILTDNFDLRVASSGVTACIAMLRVVCLGWQPQQQQQWVSANTATATPHCDCHPEHTNRSIAILFGVAAAAAAASARLGTLTQHTAQAAKAQSCVKESGFERGRG
jgi:hypothetical protein